MRDLIRNISSVVCSALPCLIAIALSVIGVGAAGPEILDAGILENEGRGLAGVLLAATSVARSGFDNKAAFARDDVLKFYLNADRLLPAEKVLFEQRAELINDSRVLDIGVGGGRTTPHLLALTDDYTGVDYVPEYVEAMKNRFPDAKFIHSDARSLDGIEDNAYDFVLFSYNGIDCVSHEGRLQVLDSVHRVLKPGGTFMFSSHNRDYEHFNKLPWQRKIVFDRGYLIFMLHCLYHLPKHFKMKRLESYTDDYAIVNDGDHRFSLLLYYISIDKQREQLEAAGFHDIEQFDQDGIPVETDTRSHWVHYLARKRATT